MHFGRIENIQGVDFHLPLDSVRTEKFLSLSRDYQTRIYIGCPIWASPKWVGDLYPKGTKPTDFLKVYSTQFNSVEVNSTFYQLLDSTRIRKWASATVPGFRFCPKVFRGITENLSAAAMPALVSQYCTSLYAFGDRLGLTFAQFPETFNPSQMPALERFFKIWPMDIPLSVELRHPGWFRNQALLDSVVNLFYRYHIASVITDTPGRRDVLHCSLTQPKVLIRFQGNNADKTDSERILEWSTRLKKWASHSLQEIYFFAHQPDDEHIPETASLALKAVQGRERVRPVSASRAEQLDLLF